MSGPKDYSPPPRYSMKVFDGKLDKVFRLQSHLKNLCCKIESSNIADTSFNIMIDCKDELTKIQKQILNVQQNLVFHYNGKFGQDTYNKINNEIDLRISSLTNMIRECESIMKEFEGKKADYECFQLYNSFYDNTYNTFESFKHQIITYLNTNIKSSSSEMRDEEIKGISEILITRGKVNFAQGFKSRFSVEKQGLIEHVIEKESAVDQIRSEICNKINGKYSLSASEQKLIPDPENIPTPEIMDITNKIKHLIANCEDKTVGIKYKMEYEKLVNIKSLQDIYFYKELHDHILNAEKVRKSKMEISHFLFEINTLKVHSTQKNEKQSLINYCLDHLNNSSIRPNITNDIKKKLEQLKNQSDKLFEEDEIKLKEHIFLKMQIIKCLQNQGYEVMTDLKVIDFEKENDFLIKINKQTNYLNLKFRDDNSIHYVFQIPEKKDELSTDKKNLKLHEMKVTCSEFKTVLSDLAAMGLSINLQSEKPIDLNTIISLTKNQKEKMKSVEKFKQVKQELRKNYLTH